MPGHLKKKGDGWVVVWGGKEMSNHPLSRNKAVAQLKALYANEKPPPPPKKG